MQTFGFRIIHYGIGIYFFRRPLNQNITYQNITYQSRILHTNLGLDLGQDFAGAGRSQNRWGWGW